MLKRVVGRAGRRRPALLRAAAAASTAALGCAIAGCAQNPPLEQAGLARCNIKTIGMGVNYRDKSGPVSLSREIGKALRSAPNSDPIVLMLSGGSENGAFGAGHLSEWAKAKGGKLPPIRVVTGVSTGALQATFALTGNPEPLIATGYEIGREEDLLQPYKGAKPKPGSSGLGVARALIAKGALGSLAPLRKRLAAMVNDDVLADVARHGRNGDLLYVGVVDMDSGEADAFDLTDLAMRWQDQVADRSRIRDCYLDAVLASASAPMAAPPVFIDGKMYVDGGLRFGLFADEIAVAQQQFVLESMQLKSGPKTPRYLAIVNTALDYVGACDRPNAKPCIVGDSHRKWRFDEVALESEKIFANQVYRLSTERLRERLDIETMRIGDPRIADWRAYRPRAADYPALTGDNCAGWRKRDDLDYRPVQFHVRYMRCMISYGRSAYLTAPW